MSHLTHPIHPSESDPSRHLLTRERILLVEDDPQAQESMRRILEMAGYPVVLAQDGQQALEIVRAHAEPTVAPDARIHLVISDVRMPRMGGLEFLKALTLCGDSMPVILMTAFGRVEDAVWAMKMGAVDFLSKPFKRSALLKCVEVALKRTTRSTSPAVEGVQGATEKVDRSTSGTAYWASSHLIGSSDAMKRLRMMIEQIAPTTASILITGESGTGKEIVARAIHERSERSSGPFIALNCAAIPENLIESELFGHEKGAFTGAHHSKLGLFEAASGGSLLLDEIGDMPLGLQSKLLRVLQEGEVRRVGSHLSRKVDVRVIAATHRDLKLEVQEGKFRQDLLYRLEVIGIHVPPLRERLSDLNELLAHFVQLYSKKHQKKIERYEDSLLSALQNHTWPGNVRELSNGIERAVVLAEGTQLQAIHLPEHLQLGWTEKDLEKPADGNFSHRISIPLGTRLKDVEDLLIRKTLEATDGDKNMTAKLLGINSRTIYRKLTKNPEQNS